MPQTSEIDKGRKPQFEAEVACPCCNTVLLVRYWRQNLAEKPEPEWMAATDVKVLAQGKMFHQDTPGTEVEESTEE